MKALVIGGTGPTGPHIVNGLLERGYETTILHRGTHETDLIPPDVVHLHADPYDKAALDEALTGLSFDVAIASYGRLRFTAEALVGKTDQVVAVGGIPAYRGFLVPEVNHPYGFPVPIAEDFPVATMTEHGERSRRVARAEQTFIEHSVNGTFRATLFRYPYVYGPLQMVPREWSIIRRLLDGRREIPIAFGGLALLSHGYGPNLAHGVLLSVDHPDVSDRKIYNCGDEVTYSLRQWVEIVADAMGVEVEIVPTPDVPGHPTSAIANHQVAHHRCIDLAAIKDDLGYRDLVPAMEALRLTTRYYLDNPLERSGELELNLQDEFDYAAEDRMIEASRAWIANAAEIAGEAIIQHHPYDTVRSD